MGAAGFDRTQGPNRLNAGAPPGSLGLAIILPLCYGMFAVGGYKSRNHGSRGPVAQPDRAAVS